MGSPTYIKTFRAAADIAGHLIVKATANRGEAALATAATAAIIGVTDPMGAKAGGPLDVHQGGTCEVRAGGAIAAGDPLTANGSGKAIKAVPTAGQVVAVVGIAMAPADADDIVDFLFAPSFIATPA